MHVALTLPHTRVKGSLPAVTCLICTSVTTGRCSMLRRGTMMRRYKSYTVATHLLFRLWELDKTERVCV